MRSSSLKLLFESDGSTRKPVYPIAAEAVLYRGQGEQMMMCWWRWGIALSSWPRIPIQIPRALRTALPSAPMSGVAHLAKNGKPKARRRDRVIVQVAGIHLPPFPLFRGLHLAFSFASSRLREKMSSSTGYGQTNKAQRTA